VSGENKADISTQWPLGPSLSAWTVERGGKTDLWGLSLDVADVTNPNFGIALSVQGTVPGSPITAAAEVDCIQIKIYYSTDPRNMRKVMDSLLPPGAIWSPNSGSDFDRLLNGIALNHQQIYDFLNGLFKIRDPYETPYLSDLEKEYGITTDERLTEQTRRDQLAAIVYALRGTGSDTYLEGKLKTAGFDVEVWPNSPEVDPRPYLDLAYKMIAGGDNAYAGYTPVSEPPPPAIAGYDSGGILIVNGETFKQSVDYSMVADGDFAFAGNGSAIAGFYSAMLFTPIEYEIGESKWNCIFFVAGDRTVSWKSTLIEDLIVSGDLIVYHNYASRTADDLTGNGNHGIPGTAVKFVKGGLLFNGGSGSNVIVPYKSDFDLTTEVTLVAHITPFEATQDQSRLISNETTGTGYSLNLKSSGGRKLNSYIASNDVDSDFDWLYESDQVIAVSFKDSTDENNFYKDGVLNAKTNAGTMLATGLDLAIGSRPNDTLFYNGIIHSILLIGRLLTDNEHEQLADELTRMPLVSFDRAQIPAEREEMIKRLILKYKPLHSWGILIADFT
jgi:hypothetical protein